MANPSDTDARGPAGSVAEPPKTETAVHGSAAPHATTPSGAVFSENARSSPTSEAAQPSTDQSLASQYAQALQRGASLSGGADQSSAGQTSSVLQGPALLGSGIKETAQSIADAVRRHAAQFAGDVSHELKNELWMTGEAQKTRGVQAMRSLARAIDTAATGLEPDSPRIARTVHDAARGVNDMSDRFSNRKVDEMIESAAEFARAQPALFIGGSIAAGFAFGRFLKSSGRERLAEGD
jgi:hypothetical protein